MEKLNFSESELKQCFQRKTLFLQPQIESASILTKIIISSLLCYNDIIIYKECLKSINYLKGELAQNLKLQSAVVTLNIRSRSTRDGVLVLVLVLVLTRVLFFQYLAVLCT